MPYQKYQGPPIVVRIAGPIDVPFDNRGGGTRCAQSAFAPPHEESKHVHLEKTLYISICHR